jgi:hypothetical protein
MNLIKMQIVHTSHQDILNRIDTSFIYKLYIYIFHAILRFEAHGFCIDILFDEFCMDFIEIL